MNLNFLKVLLRLLKVAIPSWDNSVVLDLSSLTIFLVVRTFMSIYISKINGNIVKNIVSYNMGGFLKGLATLGLMALPASFINSYLEYQNKVIALKFRQNLTKHFHSLYIKDLIYYQVHLADQANEHRL